VVLQYINGEDGTPAFVVIPYAEFERNYRPVAAHDLAESPLKGTNSLISEDGMHISLPHGGDAKIDLHRFVQAWDDRGTTWVMAVGKRRQAYEKFYGEVVNGLDAILRRCFLPANSPYKNTMQATTVVVEALVETGLFEHGVEHVTGYYRPVQVLRINEEKAREFLATHGPHPDPIARHDFILPVAVS